MVVERQTLLVLHAANFTEFAWANGEHAARAERVWIARASVRPGRSASDSHENKQNTNETHLDSDAYPALGHGGWVRNRPRGPCRDGQPWRNARTRVVNHAIHTLGGGDLYLGAIRGNRHHQTTRVENRFSFESARGPTATLPKIRWARRELKREKGVLITTTNGKSLGLVPKR